MVPRDHSLNIMIRVRRLKVITGADIAAKARRESWLQSIKSHLNGAILLVE